MRFNSFVPALVLVAVSFAHLPAFADRHISPLKIIPQTALIDPDPDYRAGFLALMTKKNSEAFERFMTSANKGHPHAQYFVSILLREGKGPQKNEREAFEWAVKSANGGFLVAADLVGIMYAQGVGVERSDKTAVEWFEKAAVGGYPEGKLHFGIALLNGVGIAKNPTKGKGWIEDAAKAGVLQAKQLLASLNARTPQLKIEKGLPSRLLPESVGYSDHLKELHERPMSESAAVIEELSKDPIKLRPPYHYELARRLWPTDKAEAFKWYFVGRLRAHYAAQRCNDRSAHGGPRLLTLIAPEVAKGIGIHTDLLEDAAEKALELETQFPADTDPYWICLHGLKAATAALKNAPLTDYATPQDTWPETREKIRAGLKEGVRKAVAKSGTQQ